MYDIAEEIPESPGHRRRRDVILPFKKNYFNFKTATAKPDSGDPVTGGLVVVAVAEDESHLSYKRACYLLTGTDCDPYCVVCVCVYVCMYMCASAISLQGRRRIYVYGLCCIHICTRRTYYMYIFIYIEMYIKIEKDMERYCERSSPCARCGIG